jgi:hypothetical protein
VQLLGGFGQPSSSSTDLGGDGVHCWEGTHDVASLQLYLLALLQPRST